MVALPLAQVAGGTDAGCNVEHGGSGGGGRRHVMQSPQFMAVNDFAQSLPPHTELCQAQQNGLPALRRLTLLSGHTLSLLLHNQQD